jgi:hypothetical protein
LTQFQISNPDDNDVDVDESSFSEGVVTPALFPRGIPLPPVKRLPAEFECNLCFRVKKFQKPSDWTKHVHEDIQPFSCTFPVCPESKSFKRKADWVRHENERHRHLEWWTCNFPECSHTCYRKDNFVQHLVREHKMAEPKVKGRGSSSSKNKPVKSSQEDNEFWALVDTCRQETKSKARDEQCRFCGNVCSSFKKLSVHMGKHMEQIAMPVLDLVKLRQVSPDTIVSPIKRGQAVQTSFAAFPAAVNRLDSAHNISPYLADATSTYHALSVGHSPLSGHVSTGSNGTYGVERAYYSPDAMSSGMQGQMNTASYGPSRSFEIQNALYGATMGYLPSQHVERPDHSISPHQHLVTPRSQATSQGYAGSFFDSVGPGYSQGPMQTMYGATSSPMGYLPQYASPLQEMPRPMGVDGQPGLGLHDLDQAQEYMYGSASNGNGRANMQFS